jgi:hypothetical protein
VDFDGTRATVSERAERPALRIRADAFAQLFAGEMSVLDTLRLGLAEADGDVSAIHAVFRTDRCFRLLDEF